MKIVDYAKWNAWNSLGSISKEEAMKKYMDEVGKLDPKWESKVKLQSKL
jgi:acyl-CoA-binding protein